MSNQSDEDIRDSIIGLGEKSIRKSYYPLLQKKLKEIKELNKTLEKKVIERTKELEKSLNDLKETQNILIEAEKMASLGGLVAGVAHEINTPVSIGLTGITHFLDITEKIKEDYENENMSKENFEEYINSSSELAALINSNLKKTAQLVKSFKQVAVDQTNEEKRKFNLKEYLNEILFSIHNVTKKTNLTINIECDENIIINSCAGAFSQIFTNLILNSIKHAYKEKEKGTINIYIEKKKTQLELIYKDDGRGIKEENLPKIFDPFFTTNREDGGTGLGLNIIYNIITNTLNGSIKCESEEGKYTKFTIIVNI